MKRLLQYSLASVVQSRRTLKTRARNIALCALLGSALSATAAIDFKVDQSQHWIGYLNAYELPQNGGDYVGGAVLDTADLPAGVFGTSLTLEPNTMFYYADWGWIDPDGTGNKAIEANFYVERWDVSGQVVFSGRVTANTLVADYTAVAFIKRFLPPDFAFIGMITVPLVGGSSFEVTDVVQPGEIMQYGFMLTGPNANPATLSELGKVVVQTEPPLGQTVLSYGFGTGLEDFENVVWRPEAPVGWLGNPSVQQIHTDGNWQMYMTKEFRYTPGGGAQNQQLAMQWLSYLDGARISFDLMCDFTSPAWHQFWLVGNSAGESQWSQTQLVEAFPFPRYAGRTWHFDLSFKDLGWEPGDTWFQLWTGANSDPLVPVNFYLDNVRVYATTPAPEQIAALRNILSGMGIAPGLAISMDAKLKAATAALQSGQTVAACGQLKAFLGEVEAQASKKQISLDMAYLLWTGADQIRALLGCRN